MKAPLSGSSVIQSYWRVDGGKTQVWQWKASNLHKSRTLLYFMPGNPGLLGYYHDFLDELYRQTDRVLDIVAVEHAEHGRDPKVEYDREIVSVDGIGSKEGRHNQRKVNGIWSVQDQIGHKLAIMEHLLKAYPQHQVMLMGHSIGAYLATQVLKQSQDERIFKCICLFPTLHQIAATPNGQRLRLLFHPWSQWLIAQTAFILQQLPDRWLLSLVQKLTGQSQQDASTTLQLIHHVARNCLWMAKTEMETILELDKDWVRQESERLVLYYSRIDDWAPASHFEHVTSAVPEVEAYLCPRDTPHAFVLDGGGPVFAEIVADWIRNWLSMPAKNSEADDRGLKVEE